MNVWYHLSTIFNWRQALRIAGLIALSVALITTLLFGNSAQAAPGVNQTLSFQGRLLNSSGGTVADGYYNMQFKIYQDGDGQTVNTTGSPSGTPEWIENHVNNNDHRGVQVKNGYFSVTLGSVTPFGSSVDWNQDTLWLSMNIADTSNSCTNFTSCNPDGEMLPMKRLTAVPYAMQAQNANTLGGMAAGNFIQLAQGVQTDTSSNTSSIFINKTATGNLIQLQNTAVDVFTVDNNGNVMMGSNSDHSIGIAGSTGTTPGRSLTVSAGTGGTGEGAYGGDLVLQGGAAGGTNENGGSVVINAGAKSGFGIDGTVSIGVADTSSIILGSTSLGSTQNIYVGANDTAGNTTNVTIGNGASSSSGSTIIQAKDSVAIKSNGTTRATFDASNTLYLGNGTSSITPANFTIQATNSSATAVAGGALTIQGGNATTGDANGGGIIIDAGAKSGSGTGGAMVLGATNASSITIGNTTSNIVTTLLGTTVFKPTTGNDSTTAFQIQRANGTALLVADTTNQTITIGSGGNTVTLSASGMSLAGSARGTKQIRLAAEYAGAVLDSGATGTNSGTMTSSLDLSNRMNYYRWTTTQVSAQTYDIVTQVPIPADFSAWAASNPLSITSRTSSTGNGTITLELRDSGGTERCSFTSLNMGSTSTWVTNTPGCLSSGTYTPGDYLTMRIRMSSTNNANVDVGNIVLNYLSSK